MNLKSEGGDDTEVPAAPLERPEQVGMISFVRRDQLSIGRHDIRGYEVVGGEAVFPRQESEPAVKREPSDAGFRHRTHRHR